MAHDPGPSSPAWWEALLRPWPLLLTGLALVGCGFVLSAVDFPAGRIFVLVLGLLLPLMAVARHLRAAEWDFHGRLESAGMVAVVGVAAAVAYFGMGAASIKDGVVDQGWDSGRLFCAFLL